ncbi:hypothetical protein JOB18_005256 [Solea senegalensis]|uniref:Uncharacterized protein n=1 Tax=Solea senegalensis TaxID=28829 RepID=A0AAV6PV73_SOLSE|nr:hypothetical protein JOB18_005256 [Solea senegalensis]
MDAPSKFFFSLEKTVAQRKQIVCLQLPDGKLTSDQAEIKRQVVNFYTELFGDEGCDGDASAALTLDLPQLSPEERCTLSSDITIDELTIAMSQMATGKTLRIDELPVDFFKNFCNELGLDQLDVFGVFWSQLPAGVQ